MSPRHPSRRSSSGSQPEPGPPARADFESSRRQPLVLVLGAFAAVSIYFSYVNRGAAFFPTLGHFFVSTLVVNLLFAVLCLMLARGSGPATIALEREPLVVHQVVLAAMLVTVQDRNQNITGVCIGAFLAISISTYLWWRGRLTERGKLTHDVILVTLVALAGRLGRILKEPFGAQSDMLVLVEKALDAMLSGHSPYRTYTLDHLASGAYELPLTYLPGTWVVYLPAKLLGMDLRITNVVLECAIVGILGAWLVRKSSRFPNLSSRWAGAGFLAVYALNGQLIRRVDTEMSAFGLALFLLFLALLSKRTLLTFGALGVTLATSQLALLLVPFVVSYTLVTKGGRAARRGLLLCVCVVGAAVVPFAATSPIGFKAGLWDHWQALRGYPYTWASEAMMNINFSLLFYRFQTQRWLPLIQIILFAGLFSLGYSIRDGYRRLARTLVWVTLALFLFVNFNLVVWEYLYQPVFLLVALSALARARFSEEERSPDSSAPGTTV